MRELFKEVFQSLKEVIFKIFFEFKNSITGFKKPR
ncbi:hypothetical protein C8D94_1011045 [Marinirhabdus gelatinilytica]|uniref:Uncharacterized protein n=1 Tax=Marinirhabdus gelatinilytica TaxID=1703343 RepID=A0A370QLB4_9FLAO|nr:hypothetical protein C8D94_1011045 [Marinirhabdus gelatinilytica]